MAVEPVHTTTTTNWVVGLGFTIGWRLESTFRLSDAYNNSVNPLKHVYYYVKVRVYDRVRAPPADRARCGVLARLGLRVRVYARVRAPPADRARCRVLARLGLRLGFTIGLGRHLPIELGAEFQHALELLHVGAHILLLLVHRALLLVHPAAGAASIPVRISAPLAVKHSCKTCLLLRVARRATRGDLSIKSRRP
eukprot:1186429-Prorocentrum_minimum.AAC.2